jgi:tetratricopeptide (TPR) repeat protein
MQLSPKADLHLIPQTQSGSFQACGHAQKSTAKNVRTIVNKNKLFEPLYPMRDTVSPQSYEYTRLHFLLESYFFEELFYPSVKAAGERLLRRNPKDTEVKMRMCEVLSYDSTLAGRRRAVTLAKELIHVNPKSAVRYGYLGNVYYGLWIGSQQKPDRDAAIAAFRKYLQLAPTDARRSERMQRLIQLLERSKDIPRKAPATAAKSR